MFGKKEEIKPTATVNTDNLQVQEEPKETEKQEESKEVSIQDILINFETRLQAIEAVLFRIKGAI